MSSSNSEKLIRKDLILSYTKDLPKDSNKIELFELSVNLNGSVISISSNTVTILEKHFQKTVAPSENIFEIIPLIYLKDFLHSFRKTALGENSSIIIQGDESSKSLEFQFNLASTTSDCIHIFIFERDLSTSVKNSKEDQRAVKLRDNIKIFQSLFENHPDAIYSFNKEGFFTNANNSALLLGEITKENVVLRNVMEVIPLEDAERVKFHFKKALGGVTQNYNTKFISFKGTSKIINVTNFPIISMKK